MRYLIEGDRIRACVSALGTATVAILGFGSLGEREYRDELFKQFY